MSLTQVTEQAALEEEALQFLLEDEHKEKEGLKQALRVAENRGKKFHEVRSCFLRGFQQIFVFPVFWYCRIGYNVLTTKIAFFFIFH